MAVIAERLPYGVVGRPSLRWYLLVLPLLAIAGWGVYAYSRQLIEGEIVTGMRDVGPMGGAAWGLYIAFVIYFVGVSFAGITVAALIRLLNLDHLRPVSRAAELLTIVALLLGAASVIADVGQPLRALINLPRFARPQSPFFGTFTLVISGYLFASLVYFYLDGRRDAALCARRATGALRRFYALWAAGYQDTPAEQARHRRAAFWLSIAILPLLVTAHSTLGFVFGIQSGRPGWYSALQAPAFLVLAGVSGIGLLIVLAAVIQRATGAKDQINMRTFIWLGNLLMMLVVAYLYFTVAELLTATYTGFHRDVETASALLIGPYAGLYWLSLGSLVVSLALLAGQALLRRHRVSLLVTAGLLVNVAAISKRVLVVVPSQTHGSLLPYTPGAYSPSWVEYSVIVGLFALGALLFASFAKVFPIMDVHGSEAEEEAELASRGGTTSSRMSTRVWLAISMVVGGFLLQAVSYFALAAPLGRPVSPLYSDPRLPFAPSLFILGVMLVFAAAVVYELLPERVPERATSNG
jgi:Ni/Fe-hydrogenase subunit HybB-like protein